MLEVQEDGHTVREHLESFYNQTGQIPAQLAEAVECPPHIRYLWDWFLDMCSQRESNGFEVGRLTARVMMDWCWLTGRSLELWERQVIRSLDDVWIRKRRQKKT